MRNLLAFIFCLPIFCEATTLFYFDESKTSECTAKTLNVLTKSEKKLLTTKTCPTAWVWDGKKIFYIENTQLSERTEDGQVKKLGSLPVSNPELWINSTSGNPVIAYLTEAEEKVVTSEKTHSEPKSIFTFEGKTYIAEYLPNWGMPYMAILAELKDGKWNRLEIEPTRSGAGETPGLSVLNKYRDRKKGKTLSDILMSSTCQGGLNCDANNESIKKLLGKQEGYGLLAVKGGGTFAFATVFGDSNHASSPVYFCEKDCTKGFKLKEVTELQIALSVNGDMVLIANEYDNTFPRIYDGKSGRLELSLPKARNAVWLQ